MNTLVNKIRLHSSQANLPLGYLQALNIPPPDFMQYKDYAAKTDKADGGQHKRGQQSFVLIWGELTKHQTKKLSEISEYDDVYATINKAWNLSSESGWIDVYGKGIEPTGSIKANTNGEIFENVRFEVRNLTVIGAASF